MNVFEQIKRKEIEMQGYTSVTREQTAVELVKSLNVFFKEGLQYVSSIKSFGLGYVIFTPEKRDYIEHVLLNELEENLKIVHKIKQDLLKINQEETEDV